jgi:putative ABC transport system permease protein
VLGHYLSVAAVNFRKAPLVALANITVLALGLTAFVATYAVTDFWNSAEKQFANSQRTFVISSRIEMKDGTVALYEVPATNPFLAEHLPIYFPQLEAVSRAQLLGTDAAVSAGGRAARLYAKAVDPEFLEIFDLPFVAGDTRTALAQPRSVVITESAAARLFGTANPLGQTVSLGNRVDATVTGVIQAVSEPSHMARSPMATLPFDLLASMDLRTAYLGLPQENGPGNWFGMDGTTYMLLPADGSLTLEAIDAGLDAIVASHMPEQQAAFGSLVLNVLPVTKMLGLDASGMFLGGRGSITSVLWLLGSLVLGIACLNYTSLGTARGSGRAHEVGVRKAIGAGAKDILLQHLLEAALLTAAALALALFFVRALSPVAETAFGIDLTFALSGEPRFLAFVVALAFAVTLLAGAFPAFVLSRVRPIFALRGYQLRVGRKLLLSVLVGIQVAAASFLSIAVAVVYLQNLEIRRTGLGIAADPLLVIENPRELTQLSSETLREQLLRVPQVSAVTAIETPILDSGTLPITGSADDGAPQRLAAGYRVADDFAAVMDLKLLAGRFFERGRDDSTRVDPRNSQDIVIDRTLAEFLGFATAADAVGKVVFVPKDFLVSFGLGTAARPLHVIGVVESKPIAIGGGAHPGAVYRLGGELPYTIARISRDNVTAAIEQIEGLWQRLVPGVALSRRFVDEIYEDEYTQHARVATAMTALCGFAVLIALIGLFAMAQVVVARRSHEIAVRKALGAKTPLMIVMLLKRFALLVLAASLAAWPAAFIAMRGYLDRFARPIELDITLFVACFLGMLLLASLTIGAQILRAARTRPSAALRHE